VKYSDNNFQPIISNFYIELSTVYILHLTALFIFMSFEYNLTILTTKPFASLCPILSLIKQIILRFIEPLSINFTLYIYLMYEPSPTIVSPHHNTRVSEWSDHRTRVTEWSLIMVDMSHSSIVERCKPGLRSDIVWEIGSEERWRPNNNNNLIILINQNY